MKNKQLMGLVKTKNGIRMVPIKESRDTYKVTDSIRRRLEGNLSGRDLSKEFYHRNRKK